MGCVFPMVVRNSGQMTIGKTHPTLVAASKKAYTTFYARLRIEPEFTSTQANLRRCKTSESILKLNFELILFIQSIKTESSTSTTAANICQPTSQSHHHSRDSSMDRNQSRDQIQQRTQRSRPKSAHPAYTRVCWK